MSSRVLISGATGLVGRRLAASLAAAGCGVRALSRSPERVRRTSSSSVEPVAWDGLQMPPSALDAVDGVVHLSGEPIFAGRLSARRRRRIRASRVQSTRSIAQALSRLPASRRPRALVCASAVGIYGSRGEEELSEQAAPGEGFLAEVCRDWEAAANEARGVRVVCLRIGIVLAREGGALPMMALPFRLFAGGRLGDGSQWVPWVHIDDLSRLVGEALRDDRYAGPINGVAPECVRNRDFTRSLASVLGRPAILPAPAFALRLVLGELAEELLGSRRVVPQRALDLGFEFAHPFLEHALRSELCPA